MVIISIDLGEKRTGVAVCDKNEILSYPLEVIKEDNKKKLIEKISQLVRENKAEMILVGFALNMNGSVGERAINCRNFAEEIKEKLSIPVALWDERQTTKFATKLLIESKTKNRKKKNIIDCVAATIILDDFLKFRKNNKEIELV